jgi:uncharacterized cupin superfamily protein
VERARLKQTENGLVPEGDGWYAANLRDIAWQAIEGGGAWCGFGSDDAPDPLQLGIGVHVLWPGDAPGFYHQESDQEGFLVLAGECVLVVEGEERTLKQWDYFHCPPGTRHITVGAGDGPCAILMIGARTPGKSILYPVDDAAARHGASVESETTSPREAYEGRPAIRDVAAPWPATRYP